MATSIRLSTETEKRLDTLAVNTGRTKAFYLRELIERGLDDIEDIYLAECELESIRAGISTTTPLADVMKRYGMES
jgi:RHH-type rel operon transcriptional repressor/antitoxin RelB